MKRRAWGKVGLALLALLLAGCRAAPPAVSVPAGFDLSGDWLLVPDRSDVPPTLLQLRARGVMLHRITSISPAEVAITLEALVQKRVPVVADVTGEPAAGYAVQGIVVDPPFVDVSVGEGEAAQLAKLMTKPLDVSGVTGTVAREMPLVLADLDAPRSISKKKVNVVVSIAPKLLEKRVLGVPVNLVGGRYKARVVPGTIEVREEYPSHLEGKLVAGEITATSDLTGLNPGSYSRQAVVKLPEGIALLESIPRSCEVVVSREIGISFTIF